MCSALSPPRRIWDSSITNSIEEVGLLVDKVIVCKTLFVPKQPVFALDGVRGL